MEVYNLDASLSSYRFYVQSNDTIIHFIDYIKTSNLSFKEATEFEMNIRYDGFTLGSDHFDRYLNVSANEDEI